MLLLLPVRSSLPAGRATCSDELKLKGGEKDERRAYTYGRVRMKGALYPVQLGLVRTPFSGLPWVVMNDSETS